MPMDAAQWNRILRRPCRYVSILPGRKGRGLSPLAGMLVRPRRSPARPPPATVPWGEFEARCLDVGLDRAGSRTRRRAKCQLRRCLKALSTSGIVQSLDAEANCKEIALSPFCGRVLISLLGGQGLSVRSAQDYYNLFKKTLGEAGFSIEDWPKAPTPNERLRNASDRAQKKWGDYAYGGGWQLGRASQ